MKENSRTPINGKCLNLKMKIKKLTGGYGRKRHRYTQE